MPSDVIWAAAIAGGVGVVGNAVTLWATQLQRASNERTEDKRIAADAQRLTAEHEELERQRRLAAYQAFMLVLGDLDRAATWAPTTDEQLEPLIARFLQLHADALLVGPDAVADAMGPVVDVLNVVGAELAQIRRLDPTKTLTEAHAIAYKVHRDELLEAQGAMLVAMHHDVRV